jgi:hypothetical protein
MASGICSLVMTPRALQSLAEDLQDLARDRGEHHDLAEVLEMNLTSMWKFSMDFGMAVQPGQFLRTSSEHFRYSTNAKRSVCNPGSGLFIPLASLTPVISIGNMGA